MKSFVLRLGEELHEELKARAGRERRSMHAVALLAVEEYLGRDKPSDSVGKDKKGFRGMAERTGAELHDLGQEQIDRAAPPPNSGEVFGMSKEEQVKRSRGKGKK